MPRERRKTNIVPADFARLESLIVLDPESALSFFKIAGVTTLRQINSYASREKSHPEWCRNVREIAQRMDIAVY